MAAGSGLRASKLPCAILGNVATGGGSSTWHSTPKIARVLVIAVNSYSSSFFSFSFSLSFERSPTRIQAYMINLSN